MKPSDNKTCILCETEGRDEVPAKYFAKFNGDLIPVCKKHNDLIKEDNLLNILDEQSSE